MYSIKHHPDSNILEVKNSNNTLYGKIYLNYGASLQELMIHNQVVIADLSPLSYDATYASSILFPFANRIKDGIYTFNGQTHQLVVNQKEENNALHGLVYNKTFQIINQSVDEDSALVTLGYHEGKKTIGFPYTYSIQLTYFFTVDGVKLTVKVKNTDSKAFPFTLGWHPYFLSEDLSKSSLNFNSTQKLIIEERNIATGLEDIQNEEYLEIKDKKLDDCWVLNSDEIKFNTPKYQLIIQSSSKNNFLQLYTPPKLNTIAIEPTTGVSDSFNNKIGLEILNANETYTVTWNIKQQLN